MRLTDWLRLDGSPDQRSFADRIGVHPVTVSKYATGRMVPRPDVAARIEAVTANQVTIADFASAFRERRVKQTPAE